MKRGERKGGGMNPTRPQAAACVTPAAEATLNVKVVPGASRDRVAGRYGDGIKVQVSAPPEDGKANRAVCELLAAVLGLRSADVQVVRGHGQPRKIVKIAGIGPAELEIRLAAAMEG